MEVGVVNIAQQPTIRGLSSRPQSGSVKGKKLYQCYSQQKKAPLTPRSKLNDDFGIGNGYNGAQQALVCCEVASRGKRCGCNQIGADVQTSRRPTLPPKKTMTFHSAGIPADILDPKTLSKGKNRPASAKVNGGNSEKPTLIKLRPTSAHTIGDKNLDAIPEPFVYGYSSQKTVSGDKNHPSAQYQYRKPTTSVKQPTRVSVDQLWGLKGIDKLTRVPKTLEPLLPWLTTGVPEHIIGVDSDKCMVFLPSLCSDYESLPVVPGTMSGNEDLPFKEDLTEAVIPPPKKYEHPSWNKLHLSEWNCAHTGPPSHLRIYATNGSLLHESKTRDRTVDVVRQEISELEELLKGIGSANGCSMVVQYQAEINRLQRTVNNTLGRVEDIERRLAEEAAKNEPTDHFGYKACFREHDDIMQQILQQHTACIEELAQLEADMGMESSRKHFKKQLPASKN